MQHVCTGAGCGKLHNQLGRCPSCKLQAGRDDRQYRETRSEVRQWYYSTRWKRMRARVLKRDHGLCQQCLRQGRTNVGNHIDHIKPAVEFPELFFTMSNLQTLCPSCHSIKTNATG